MTQPSTLSVHSSGWVERFGLTSAYPRASSPIVEAIGLVALLAFAFFWLLHIDASQVAEGVLFLLFLGMLWHGPSTALLRDPLVWVVLAWVGYQFLFVPRVVAEFPELTKEQIGYAQHYAKIALIPIVAWWLGGSARTVALVLGLVVVGFVLGVTFQEGGVLDSMAAIRARERVGLGYRNWEHGGVYAAFGVLALLGLGHLMVGYFGTWRKAGGVLLLGAGLYCFWIVIISQTRAAWLGLLIAAMAAAIAAWFTRRSRPHEGGLKAGVGRRKAWGIAAGVALLAGMVITFEIHEVIQQRVDDEQQVISKILSGDLERMPLTSVGMRVVIWRQAMEWIGERPLLGWGPKTRAHLFENGDLPRAIYARYKIHHFHNQPIELAVAYGLVGIAFFATMFWLIGRAAVKSWHDGRMPRAIVIYGAATVAFWFTVNLFESYFNYPTGTYINALLGGLLYTFSFSREAAR